MKRRFLLLILLAIGLQLPAQHLQRRGIWGAQGSPATDSALSVNKVALKQAVIVDRILPGGTFEALGVQAGDILLRINDRDLLSPADLQSATKAFSSGVELTIKGIRAGKAYEKKGKVLAMPFEASTEKVKVQYGEVAFQNGWIRSIFKQPAGPGPHPTVFFMMGYNCGSVDNLPPHHPYTQIMDTLLQAGYAVYRIEKPGVGDGPHPCQCSETGFDMELDVFEAGYRDMLKKPAVDSKNVFMFGHSMGGIQAPLLAQRPGIEPKGIAVYGTAFQSWYEYIIAMCRYQFPRNGLDYKAFETDMRAYIDLFYAHYVQMKPLDEILRNPAWTALLKRDFELKEAGDLLWRRWFYWQELAKKDPVTAWSDVDAHVLALYGGADFEVFNPNNMEEIVRIVNSYHPGKGKFVQLDGADHMMIQVGGMEELLNVRSTPQYRKLYMENMDRRVLRELVGWMKAVGGA